VVPAEVTRETCGEIAGKLRGFDLRSEWRLPYPSCDKKVVIPPKAANADGLAIDTQAEEQGGEGCE
jgi:hypothetical protein